MLAFRQRGERERDGEPSVAIVVLVRRSERPENDDEPRGGKFIAASYPEGRPLARKKADELGGAQRRGAVRAEEEERVWKLGRRTYSGPYSVAASLSSKK